MTLQVKPTAAGQRIVPLSEINANLAVAQAQQAAAAANSVYYTIANTSFDTNSPSVDVSSITLRSNAISNGHLAVFTSESNVTVNLANTSVRNTYFHAMQYGNGTVTFVTETPSPNLRTSFGTMIATKYDIVSLRVLNNVAGDNAEWLITGSTAVAE
jgi:hypothetical protein